MDHDRLPALVRELGGAGLSDAAVTVALRRWSDVGGKFSHYDNFRSSVCVFLDRISRSSTHLADTPLVKSMSRAAAADMTKGPKYEDSFDLIHIWVMFRSWGPTERLAD